MSNIFVPRIGLPFEERRGDLYQLEAQTIAPTRVSGFEVVAPAGEVAFDVDFRLWFVEKPAMSFGGEMDDTQPLTEKKFPTVSVVVFRWIKAQTDRPGGGYFTGATLAVVTTGPKDLKMTVHWQAEGKAMVNPVQADPSLGGPL